MLTRMTDHDWAIVLELFRACRSRRGAKGRDDRRSLEALHDFAGHNITWRALPADLDGLPLAFHLTAGQASDGRRSEIRLDLGPEITPRAAVADKGYDAEHNRAAARAQGIRPVIPHRSTAKARPAFLPRSLDRARARIGQPVGRLQRFERIALRCEKTDGNFASFVALALGFILIKSVHRA